jgi:hypothetical protein
MWTEGRQGNGYFKKKLFISKLLKMDCYLLRFPKGCEVRPHTDPVEGKDHHRINVILKKAKRGGEFYIKHLNINWLMPFRWFKFRPDLVIHGMTEVEEGEALWLSVGWTRNVK